MKFSEESISKLMKIGVIVSGLLIIFGGALCLLIDGHQPYLKIYQEAPKHILSMHDPKSLIFLGVWVLLVSQILRVMLVAWLFYNNREKILCWVSVFIFTVLTLSIFFR